MKKRTNIIFSSFSTQDDLFIENIYSILKSTEYTEDTGMGYSDLEVDENVLHSTLIKRTVTSILGFSSEINDFKKIEIPIFDKIPFCMDFEKKLLYTFGATANHNKIKSALRNTFDFSLIYTDFNLTPVDIMKRILDREQYFSIDEIVIRQFKYNNGVSGKYIAKVFNQTIGKEIINEHSSDILKVSMNVTGENDYYLIISSNNALNIKCEEIDFYRILENLKNKIHG